MTENEFRVGEFRMYEAKVEGISLGFIDTGSGGGYSPGLGEHIHYDGITVILKDGREFTDVPQLRTAIQSGWFVRVGDQVTQYRPKAAGIQVRPTETRGNERAVRTTVVTEIQEDAEVGSVQARKAHREQVNADAGRRVPAEVKEAVIARHKSALTGDQDLDGLLEELDHDMNGWLFEQQAPQEPEEIEEEDDEAEIEAQAEEDILSLLAWVEEEGNSAPKKKRKKKAAKKSARSLPVDMQDERPSMPIVREDPTENAGTVVGNVSEQQRTVIERTQELAMKDVAQAKPPGKSPAPKPRLGGAGAIVVDEQRDMGQIALSSNTAPIRMEESAKVSSGQTETIKMGEGAQVGGHAKKARAIQTAEGQEGVAVGRVLSPTKTSFEANDRNTSSTAIQRAQEGKQLRVERFETDEQVVGNVSEGSPAKAVATGDVQEAQAGDELTDILPDAAQGPKPQVYKRPEDDPAYAAVKMLIPDFEWDKDRPVKVKVAAALKKIENPQYIKGILAVESDVVKEELKKAIAAELEKRKKAKKKAK